MHIERIVPDLTVDDLERAVLEHRSVLGMQVLMDLGWIVTLGDDDGHQLTLMTTDPSAPMNPDVSVFVDDVHEALQELRRRDWRSCTLDRRALGSHALPLPRQRRAGRERRQSSLM